MRLLLDTHALLWWLASDPALDPNARAAIADEDSFVAVSAASAWEIAIKRALGRLDAPDDLDAQLDAHQFADVPVTVVHALRAGALPSLHTDLFDRILVAQAQVEGLTIVTRDENIPRYDVATLRA